MKIILMNVSIIYIYTFISYVLITFIASSQISTSHSNEIQNFFTKQRLQKRALKEFSDIEFIKYVLHFIISNNLSFRVGYSQSFKDLLKYLRE
jgi:hypothetical protein